LRPSPRRAGHPSKELQPAATSLPLLLVLPLPRLVQVLPLPLPRGLLQQLPS
jgi:hypothetical protein